MENKNVKVFTHNDMDGFGVNILLSIVGGIDGDILDIDNLDYNTANQKIMDFCNRKDYDDYDIIYITDLSLELETLKKLDSSIPHEKLVFIDHHPKSMKFRNVFDWMTVEIKYSEKDKDNTCATQLLYDRLINLYPDSTALREVEDIVTNIREYDTFSFKYVYNTVKPPRLNMLFQEIGGDEFVEDVLELLYMYNYNNILDALFRVYADTLDVLENNITKYCKRKSKYVSEQFIMIDSKFYKFGIVYADSHIGEVSQYILTENKKLDFIIVVDLDRCKGSIRTIKDDVPCNIIAQHFKGDGHPQASGFTVNKDIMENLNSMITGISDCAVIYND